MCSGAHDHGMRRGIRQVGFGIQSLGYEVGFG